MPNENTEIVKSEFQIMDEADSQQIQDAETAVKQALVYEVRGKKQLSYMGVKWLVLKMSQKEQPIEVIDMPQIDLVKHEPDNKSTWIWYATIKVRNRKTGLSTVGASESPYLNEKNVYDTFGRTKSLSKAERNACRKQIPEIEINAMLNSISNEDIQKLNTGSQTTNSDTPSQNTTPVPVAAHYLETLEKLGYDGIQPKTSYEAADLIKKLKDEAKENTSTQSTQTSVDCTCDDPIPSSINPNICQTCRKLLEKVQND